VDQVQGMPHPTLLGVKMMEQEATCFTAKVVRPLFSFGPGRV